MTHKKAFSVIELLFVLTILSVTLIASLPFSKNFVAKNRTEKTINNLKTIINFARISAISRGEPVKLCASTNKKSCDKNWENGQIVISTYSNKVLRILPPLYNGDRLKLNNKNNVLIFSEMGLVNGYQGSFYYCPIGSNNATVITVSASGRVKISNKSAKGEIIGCNF